MKNLLLVVPCVLSIATINPTYASPTETDLENSSVNSGNTLVNSVGNTGYGNAPPRAIREEIKPIIQNQIKPLLLEAVEAETGWNFSHENTTTFKDIAVMFVLYKLMMFLKTKIKFPEAKKKKPEKKNQSAWSQR